MHIQLGYRDPATQAVSPDAVWVIEYVDVQVVSQMTNAADKVELDVPIYVNVTAMRAAADQPGSVAPIASHAYTLSPEETSALRDQFRAALYNVLLAREEFAGASLET